MKRTFDNITDEEKKYLKVKLSTICDIDLVLQYLENYNYTIVAKRTKEELEFIEKEKHDRRN